MNSIKEEHCDRFTSFTKKQIVKNLSLISFSFLLVFTSFDGLSMLQTSMNQNIGATAMAICYLVFGISSLLLPKYIIKKIGCKTAICLGMAMYLPYEASNFYPEYYTMLPTAVLVGIGATLMWGAQSTYYNECCFLYWKITSDTYSKCVHLTTEITDENSVRDIPDNEYIKPSIKFCVSLLETNKITPQSLNESEIVEHILSQKISSEISNFDNVPTDTNNDFNIKSVFNENSFDALNNKHEDNSVHEEVFESTSKIPKDDITSSSTDDKNHIKPVVQNSNHKTTSLASINALFFGFHGFIYQSSLCYSNLISHFILNKGNTYANISSDCHCGAQFCNEISCFESETLEELPSNLRYMLTTICLILGIAGVSILFFFLDNLESEQPSTTFSFELLFAGLRHAKKKEQIFLIPLSVYVGMERGFFIGDYTRSYVACSLGIDKVGLITVMYGLTCTLASPLGGIMVKIIGRIPVFILGLVIDICTCLLVLLWKPNPDQIYLFFTASALFGIFNGIFWSQVIAFYGILFKKDEEAAFGFHYLCSSLGTTISFAYNDYLCSYMKIYVLFFVVTLAIIGYLMCERLHALNQKENRENINNTIHIVRFKKLSN